MASGELITSREGLTLIATLNRPEKLNALNKELYEELKHLVDVLQTDKAVRVVVITGIGDKAFSVGADLKERHGMNEKDIVQRLEFVHTLFSRIERLPQVVIAAINGTALGGGLEMALACDLRIASENATLGLPEVGLAIIPGTGGTQRLSRVIGLAKALEFILCAKRISAKEALSLGLVNAVAPAALGEALTWALKISEAGPIALCQAKFAIRAGFDASLEEGLRMEKEAYKAVLHSKDRLEGLRAFSEKRKPVFRGE